MNIVLLCHMYTIDHVQHNYLYALQSRPFIAYNCVSTPAQSHCGSAAQWLLNYGLRSNVDTGSIKAPKRISQSLFITTSMYITNFTLPCPQHVAHCSLNQSIRVDLEPEMLVAPKSISQFRWSLSPSEPRI
jgi:hypothetical protein